MKTRILAVLLIVVLALGLVGAVSADNGCYDLSAEDCAIVQGANANSAGISSFNMDWSIDFLAEGLETVGMMFGGGIGDSITFSNTGSGPFVFTGDPELPFALYTEQTASAGMGADVQDFGSFPFAIVNGFMYIPSSTGVVGIPANVVLDEAMAAAGSGMSSMGLPAGALDMSSMGEINNFGDLMGAESSGMADLEPLLSSYVNYVRLADEDMMGQTMYPFEYSLDLGALLNSEEFSQVLGMAGSLAPEDDPSAAAVLQMAPMILSGLDSEFAVTQWVGADDNFIHLLGVDWSLALDISPLMGAEPGSMDPITVDFSFEVELSDINADLSVPVPEGATELTEEQAAAMLGG